MGVVPLEHAEDPAEYGGKAFHLGAARRAGLPVPPGVAVSVAALSLAMNGDGEVRGALSRAADDLGGPLAARSSAVGEDGASASFAGQHATVLGLTTREAVLDGLRTVFRSAHSEAALAYRRKRGIDQPVRIAAVLQKLVDADFAGVLFTRNPVTRADEVVIEASWGLGESVVAGLVTPDHYRLTKAGKILEARPGEKDVAIRRSPAGGTCEVPVDGELVTARCLDDGWLGRLHELARRCEGHFGPRLDIEWAVAGDTLYLLQARPISTRS